MSGRAVRSTQLDSTQALYMLQQNPKKILDNARKGLMQDLVELSNFWPAASNVPQLLNFGVIGVFLTHLDGSTVPALNSRAASIGFRGSPTIDKAWVSLAGISKIGPFLCEDDRSADLVKAEKNILAKWKDIFKWCSFFYATRIAPVAVSAAAPTVSPQLQRSALDFIPAVLYALSRSEPLRDAMVRTAGSLELATRMWILEDECPVPTSQDIPICTAALDGLLRVPNLLEIAVRERPVFETEEEKEDRIDKVVDRHRAMVNGMLDRIVKTAGESSKNVNQLLLKRIKTVNSSPQIATPYSAINLDLMGHLCRTPTHDLRMGFLAEGAIKMCTKVAVTICGMLDMSLGYASQQRARIDFGGQTSRMQNLSDREENLLGALVAAIGFLSNTLESTDGFSWVNSSVNAGLLTAWTSAAKYMKYMHPEDADMIMMILRDTLPRYLVYRSVVGNVKHQVTRLRDSKAESKKSKKSTSKAEKGKANWDLGKRKGEGDELDMVEWIPEARNIWRKFEKLALERYIISRHMKAVKSLVATCDNVKCQKMESKNNFMKCSGCGTSLYCSRECQIVAWKEGGHKNVCKMKQTEVAEGKYEIITKSDADYFHHLSTCDARHNMPLLREMANASYPDLPPTALVICIDYLRYPTKFSVHPLADHDKHGPKIAPDASANSEARNDELINRARENPGKYGVVQSKIANGQGQQLVLSVVPGAFWDDAGWVVDEEDSVEYRAEADNDEEEEEAFLAKLQAQGREGLDGDDSKGFLGLKPEEVERMMSAINLKN
ncbi:hypothetical protein CPB83DRAFT_858740 [Crepidotus variabilis]|uniref:MYND-type domain-containing protein n=1 Tax=Crepidotus variabilis TaxID=179855 RepID=A0A9P6EAM1_9AGAR|nr:hypothetical protein CPB83DRAFT_858740 [Crepidotus variabilis]